MVTREAWRRSVSGACEPAGALDEIPDLASCLADDGRFGQRLLELRLSPFEASGAIGSISRCGPRAAR